MLKSFIRIYGVECSHANFIYIFNTCMLYVKNNYTINCSEPICRLCSTKTSRV